MRPSCFFLLLGLFAAAPATDAGAAERGSWLVSIGPDFGAGTANAWQAGLTTIEYRARQPVVHGLRPVYALAASRRGAVLASAGLHASFFLGPVEITPHFSVGIYHGGPDGQGSKERLQFRTGVDAFLPIGEDLSLGFGVYHVSNARITSASANLDVARVSLRKEF